MRMCFTINGKKYCPKIPIRKRPWDWLWERDILDYEQWVFGQPGTTPWLETEAISRETVLDLSVLAGIENLIGGLQNLTLKKQLTIALKDSLASLELPAEVNVHLSEQIG